MLAHFALRRAALLLVLLPSLFAADHARHGRTETALDRYVAQPDASFSWKKIGEMSDDSGTAYILDLVSQNWLTPAEVSRTEWRHWLTIIKPANLEHSTALLFISGGANRPGNPPRPSRELIDIAKATRSVVVDLRMVPNQTLMFHGDGKERNEDDLIAYTWVQYLKTGDERWPARLPMTKAVGPRHGRHHGVSRELRRAAARRSTRSWSPAARKRGWTAWTVAAVDRRVVGLAPIVIDVLNIEASIKHHYRAYGFYAPAVGDYVRHGVLEWHDTPEAKALYEIEDPFAYRDRLTLPKLMINAAGDQFFLPDSSRFYFADLPGPKFLRYIPNTDHGLKNTDAYRTLASWHHALLTRAPLPEFTWKKRPGRPPHGHHAHQADRGRALAGAQSQGA
jgi:PhoPQ-activated pathogenicity-related protein